jgi:hypothetical protein
VTRTVAHGRSRYQAGCRCADCTIANSDYVAGRIDEAPGRVEPAAPWRTIIRAVAWQMDTDAIRIVKACGVNGRTASGILTGRYHTISPYTAQRLRKLLELLPTEGGD